MQMEFPISVPPVDMERLNYVSEGDLDNVREIVDIYIRQTEEHLAQIKLAIQDQSAFGVQSLAHSSIGASSTCGMVAVIAPLRELERMGYERQLAGAMEHWAEAGAAFEQIKQFLAAQSGAIIPV